MQRERLHLTGDQHKLSYKIVFRCDAGLAPEIGTGHIARSKTLAREIIKSKFAEKQDILFLTRNDKGYEFGEKYLRDSDFEYKSYSKNVLAANSESEVQLLANLDTDFIFLDRLSTSKELVEAIRLKGIKVVTFDDYGSGREIADLAISAIFNDLPNANNLLKGYEYLILSEGSYETREIKEEVETIVATFGGNDARNFCADFLNILNLIPSSITIDIVLGKVKKKDIEIYKNQIKKLMNHRFINIHIFPTNYHEIISKADIAVTSGGLSIFEFSAYGIPSVGLPQYPHQLKTIKDLEDMGASILGTDEMIFSQDKFINNILTLINDNRLRKKMSITAKKNIDGNGLYRIMQALENQFEGVFYEK